MAVPGLHAHHEQCIFSSGDHQKPGNILISDLSASSTVIPLTISVRADAEAIALAHPNVLNFASLIRLFSSTLKVNLRHHHRRSNPPQRSIGIFHLPNCAGVKSVLYLICIFHIVTTPELSCSNLLHHIVTGPLRQKYNLKSYRTHLCCGRYDLCPANGIQ